MWRKRKSAWKPRSKSRAECKTSLCKAPPVFESLQVLGCCHPARMVSGDYYDYQLVDGKLAIAIGDVAGKGISAALLMASIQAAMRMELRASVEMAAPSMNGLRFSTARMVSELNQQLHATTSPKNTRRSFSPSSIRLRGCSLIRMRGICNRFCFVKVWPLLWMSMAPWWARFRFPLTKRASWSCAVATCWCATPTASPSPRTIWRDVRGRAVD